jgi:chromosome segregation ATPase
MSVAKSQKIALDSMQQEIAALGERNASLHRNYEELQQSHKAAQIEHESQMNELRQQLDASIESSRRFASESSATSAQTELLKHQVLSQESELLSLQSKLSSAQESYERKLRQAQTSHKERIDELEQVRSDLTEQVSHFQEEVSGLKSELQAETASGSRTLEQVTQKFESALAELATKDQVIARLQGEVQGGGKASRGISRMQRFLRTTSKSGVSPSKVLHGLVDRLNDVSRVLGMDSLLIDEWEQRVACEVSSQLVVSVPPENETLRARHRAIFDTVRQVMLSFPIAREEVDVGSPDRLEEELLQLKSMVELVRGLFDERERHIQDLVSMIDAQHQAVMSMSQSRDQPQASTHTLRKLQHVVATDSAGRKLMLSSSRP